jgi:hypothetical protein
VKLLRKASNNRVTAEVSRSRAPLFLGRLLLFAGCAVAAYAAVSVWSRPETNGTSAGKPSPPVVNAAPKEPVISSATESPLIAEWESLRTRHGATSADLPEVYTAVKEITDPFRRRAYRSALLAEWATTDPQAALAFLNENDRGNAPQLMREWLRLDPDAALDVLLAGGAKNHGGLRGMLSEIAQLAPRRLAQVVASLPIHETNRWDTTAQDAFVVLARTDPGAARAAAESVTGPLRGQALAGVAQVLAETDGARALAWAEAIPAGEARDTALKGALIGWAKTDPTAALEKIDLVPPGGEEMYHASDVGAQVLREAAKRDWNGTIQWLRDHPGKLGRSSMDGLQSVVSHRLTTDPTDTLRSLAKSGVPGIEHVLANSLLNEGYAQRDTVWKWLDEQPPDAFSRSVRGSLLNAIAWKEPEIALEFLEKLPDAPDNHQLFENGTRSLINGGNQMHRFEDLLAKASPKIRPYLLETGFTHGFGNIVTEPAVWLARLEELPADRRGNAMSALAGNWARSDPEKALEWAMSLKDSAQREAAFNSATSSWAAADVYEASQWINSLPAGGDRDIAVHSLAGALARSEPESAWTWALTIGNPTSRRNALSAAYFAMSRKDAAIADQMLQNADLPAADKKQLRDSFAAHPRGGEHR